MSRRPTDSSGGGGSRFMELNILVLPGDGIGT